MTFVCTKIPIESLIPGHGALSCQSPLLSFPNIPVHKHALV